MKKVRLRGGSEPPSDGIVSGIARVDRRTKTLLARLQPGEIAVISHRDIDRIAAEGLVQRQAGAVVNAECSSTGRYPNLGPMLLCSAGVTVLDEVGPDIMSVAEGERLLIEGERVYRTEGSARVEIARGRVLDLVEAEEALDHSKQAIAAELERFAANTIGFIKDERDLLLEATRLPAVTTDFDGRHVLVVVRGYDYKEDLRA
ncbi:MAG: hypothetical protein H0V60_02820, partial [Actinobacteria bacterium]|nr:hypothetical protein [Actinomycetota bacterium]